MAHSSGRRSHWAVRQGGLKTVVFAKTPSAACGSVLGASRKSCGIEVEAATQVNWKLVATFVWSLLEKTKIWWPYPEHPQVLDGSGMFWSTLSPSFFLSFKFYLSIYLSFFLSFVLLTNMFWSVSCQQLGRGLSLLLFVKGTCRTEPLGSSWLCWLVHSVVEVEIHSRKSPLGWTSSVESVGSVVCD